ncbi:MAG: hypothetical protein LKF06_08360 [Prevotella sp.]|jgi:peptidoglycan hydrolase CwlO-like protein|nr:hypothetical protein [Prevotella sp.]MCH4018270.1 hypothetical protein [Prevotella sp.]MCH4100589.1 hypothetical protein [Prevotella sp.]MCI1324514.1 hypothetical protein [Prevotella sp.]MCI1349213.1 hypothetical protein [Prevotella sp.]
MTKDEIIASLLDQLKDTNNQVTALTGRVNELLAKVAELTAIIKALQEEKGAKEKTLKKANNKGQQHHQGHGRAPQKGKRATGGEAAAYR